MNVMPSDLVRYILLCKLLVQVMLSTQMVLCERSLSSVVCSY